MDSFVYKILDIRNFEEFVNFANKYPLAKKNNKQLRFMIQMLGNNTNYV